MNKEKEFKYTDMGMVYLEDEGTLLLKGQLILKLVTVDDIIQYIPNLIFRHKADGY